MFWKRLPWVFIPGLLAVGIDRWTKIWATEHLMHTYPRSYWNDFFRFQYALNEGAFLSLGSGMPEKLRYWLLAIIPVLVLGYILAHVFTGKHLNRFSQAAFGLILGGGGSNIFDRILEGHVVDFMNMGIGQLRTGIFNVADMAIMAGLFMLLPSAFQKPKAVAQVEIPAPAEETQTEERPEQGIDMPKPL